MKRKGARGPKPAAGRELSQVGFPKVSWPPDFPCRPLGALSLWLSGTSGKAGFSLAPGLVLFFFQFWGQGTGVRERVLPESVEETNRHLQGGWSFHGPAVSSGLIHTVKRNVTCKAR